MNLDYLNKSIDAINIFVGFFALLISLGQLLVKKKQWFNYIVSIIYFCYGVMNLDFALLLNGVQSEWPHLFAVVWPFHCFIMPAAYLYIKILVNPNYELTRKHLFYFLPGLLCFIMLIPLVFIKSADFKIKLIQEFNSYHLNDPLLMYTYIAIVIFKSIFVVLSINETRFVWNADKIKNVMFFRIVFLLSIELIVAYFFVLISILVKSDLMLRIDSLVFNQIIFIPFLLSYRYPNLMHNFSVAVSEEKYKQSQINGLNVDSVVSRLNDLLGIEKIFTDPELNINTVSEQLQISSHQLSEIINKKLQVNFRTLIKNYRIEEAQGLLIDKPDDTILKIAYAVGFNSKTTFNNTFVNITSMTPSEYRQKNLKNL